MASHEFSQPPPNLNLDNPLWHASVGLWEDERIATGCLQLQAAGCSVSRILTAIWLTANGVAWDGIEPGAIRQWRRQCTESFRQLRASLDKNNPVSAILRKQAQVAELTAEKIELAWIYNDLITQNENLLEKNQPDDGHILPLTRYNALLLIANLNAAAPDVSASLQSEHGMTQLTNTLLYTGEAADETLPQRGGSR